MERPTTTDLSAAEILIAVHMKRILKGLLALRSESFNHALVGKFMQKADLCVPIRLWKRKDHPLVDA